MVAATMQFGSDTGGARGAAGLAAHINRFAVPASQAALSSSDMNAATHSGDHIGKRVTAGARVTEAESKPESAEAISKAVATVTDHQASDADVARVRSRLAAGGWPLAKPEHFDPANWP
jgi:hypothetical protein